MDKEVPGGRKPLATWEKWYWGAGVVAVSAMLFKYLSYKPPKTPEELEVRVQVHSLLVSDMRSTFDFLLLVLMFMWSCLSK